jgi:hypothetical protein
MTGRLLFGNRIERLSDERNIVIDLHRRNTTIEELKISYYDTDTESGKSIRKRSVTILRSPVMGSISRDVLSGIERNADSANYLLKTRTVKIIIVMEPVSAKTSAIATPSIVQRRYLNDRSIL